MTYAYLANFDAGADPATGAPLKFIRKRRGGAPGDILFVDAALWVDRHDGWLMVNHTRSGGGFWNGSRGSSDPIDAPAAVNCANADGSVTTEKNPQRRVRLAYPGEFLSW